MLGGIPEELQEHVGVVDDLGDRLGILGAVVDLERLDRQLGLVDILGVVNLLHRRNGAWVHRFRQCSKNIGLFVPPAALLSSIWEHLPHGLPEPQGAVADREHRCGHAAAAAIAQQISPRLGGFAVAVGQGHQFLSAISADPDQMQCRYTLTADSG
jgi:hypothetical protein